MTRLVCGKKNILPDGKLMGFFAKWRIHKTVRDSSVVDVSEQEGVRSLHMGSDTVHSAMRIRAPNDLELAYTRSMMAFLLFMPEPEKVLMIGLGGGSLLKFIHHYMPAVKSTVVEINPQVFTVAQSHFAVPPEDDRFRLEIADGSEYVPAHPASADVIMLDGYDENCLVESLTTQAFYDSCAEGLTENGILVVNLWGSDMMNFDVYLKRIETSFDGLVLCLPAERRGNIIVFGFKKSPGSPRWSDLREKAKILESRYKMEFLKFVEGIKDSNLHSEKRLLL